VDAAGGGADEGTKPSPQEESSAARQRGKKGDFMGNPMRKVQVERT
jgi:hypothetical protein